MAVKRKRAGRRAGGVNKSELIREMLNELGSDSRNRDVIAKLKDRDVVVSPAQVSNVKRALAKGGKPAGRGRPAAGGADSVSFAALLEAKKLAEAMGGIDRARRALDALARLS